MSTARERVEAYLSARARRRGSSEPIIDIALNAGEVVHLYVADLRSLLERKPVARSKTNMRAADWEIIGEALSWYDSVLERRIETGDEDTADGRAAYNAAKTAYRQLHKTLGKVREREIDSSQEETQ